MADSGCAEPGLRDALGLYLVGRLPDDEVTEVERHLGSCVSCQAEADRVGEAVLMLALLSDVDRADLVAEFGVPAADRPPAVEQHASVAEFGVPAADRPSRDSRTGPRDSRTGPRDSRTGPAESRTGPARTRTGPGRSRRRPRRLALVGAGLAVVLSVLAGVLVGQPALNRMLGPDSPTTLVADAADASTGATLSVTVTARGADLGLRATVTGLTADAPYRLYVTDVDGRSRELAALIGAGRPQEVTATCPVPLEEIARFSVTAGDGSLAVAAQVELHRTTPPPD